MRRIETMTVEELREEVNFWRQNAACWLSSALFATAEGAMGLKAWRYNRSPGRQVRELSSVLGEALTGEGMFPGCEGCGKPVKPGELVVSFEDVGEMHARCAGASGDQLRDGGRIPVPLESLSLEEGEAPPDDPALSVYASSDLYTPEHIEAFVTEGRAWLESSRGRRWA